MPIPNDPHNRFWVDVSSVNPTIVDGLRPSLVAFLAFDHGHLPSLAGTGFVIGNAPDLAIAITAKHVLTEGVLRIQRPMSGHAPSALFVHDYLKKPSIDEAKLRAIWMGSESADLLFTRHISYNDTLDIACCIFAPQENCLPRFEPTIIPLDTTRPSVGDVVHMVSQDGLAIPDYSPATDITGKGETFSIQRRVSIRVGTVTAIYLQGFRQYRWPCFTTSIPAEPGMSGGFVYIPRDGETIAACGIICADNSPPAARTDYSRCGESVIACAWPTLCLTVPEYATSDSPMRTLYDMMQAGHLTTAIGGIDHIHVIDLGNGESQIVYGDA